MLKPINMAIFSLSSLLLMNCTYNVSLANVNGKASDVIDETATNNPNISPNIKIPSL